MYAKQGVPVYLRHTAICWEETTTEPTGSRSGQVPFVFWAISLPDHLCKQGWYSRHTLPEQLPDAVGSYPVSVTGSHPVPIKYPAAATRVRCYFPFPAKTNGRSSTASRCAIHHYSLSPPPFSSGEYPAGVIRIPQCSASISHAAWKGWTDSCIGSANQVWFPPGLLMSATRQLVFPSLPYG